MATSTYNVLIIENNDWDREQVRQHLAGLSTPVRILSTRESQSANAQPDLIVLGFSDQLSLDTSRSQLDKARAAAPHSQLILCAPREIDDLDKRVIQLRARAFLLKPIDETTFKTLLEDTLLAIERRKQRSDYTRSSRKASRITDVIGGSEQIRSVLTLLERVAESATTSVLLLGESGVGKSLFAQVVHETCEASSGPLIEINCAALPSQLLESELFGYQPGAFTDARNQKVGLIELADGGTLFLDEITEIDIVTQAKILKFLDTRRFRRLGGDQEISVDVRIVAASNRDIHALVREGEFREDLFYRLNVVEVHIPPLRERREDIDIITDHYLAHYKKKFGKPDVVLSDAAYKLIRSYDWPGNVRELINVLERAVLLCPDDTIERPHLPIEETAASCSNAEVDARKGPIDMALPPGGVTLEAVERALILETLELTRGNVSKAAQMLGVSRGSLRNKLTRHHIDPHRSQRHALVSS